MFQYFSRWIRIGVVACIAVATSSVIQAQEYLPPVIDRSSTVTQVQPHAVEQQANVSRQVLSLEDRVKRLERLLDNQALVDMLMQLETMQSESEIMHGNVENIGHSIEAIKQRQRDLYLDMDRRLRQLELAANTPGPSPTTAVTPSASVAGAVVTDTATTPNTVAATAAATPTNVDPEVERSAYQNAFEALKGGEYDKAISKFQGFLANYPSGSYTDNAQYWLGEANYVTRHFKVAEQEFLKVLELHPDSSKVADAMLKLGYTYYELGNWVAARKTLENAVSRFPNTTVGRLAENRLQKMRLEGR